MEEEEHVSRRRAPCWCAMVRCFRAPGRIPLRPLTALLIAGWSWPSTARGALEIGNARQKSTNERRHCNHAPVPQEQCRESASPGSDCTCPTPYPPVILPRPLRLDPRTPPKGRGGLGAVAWSWARFASVRFF